MKTEKWLVAAIILLSISIAFSGLFINKSILAMVESKKQVIEQKINEDILSFSEASVYLKISEEKLNYLVDNAKLYGSNGIPYYKIGNNILFSKTALAKWIVSVSEIHLEY